MELKDFSVGLLLTKVFNWAYDNDLTLYRNLDRTFEAFKCRSGIDDDESKQMKEYIKDCVFNPISFLSVAISIADYQDILKFGWTFNYNRSVNKGEGDFDWRYSNMKEHPYSSLIPLIENRMNYLKENKLNTLHKSTDYKKHKHFRWWINHLLNGEEKVYSMRLFIENDTYCFDTLHIGNRRSQGFQTILQYILDNNICPNPHYNKLNVPDFVNPDYYHHPRYITSSGRFGGFWYLVYLTHTQLQEIYKTKIKKHKLNIHEKAYWAYINSLKDDYEIKFYIFMT